MVRSDLPCPRGDARSSRAPNAGEADSSATREDASGDPAPISRAIRGCVWFVGTLAVTPLVLLMLAWIEDHRKQTGTGPSYYGGAGPWVRRFA
jgi:hypothetical protein